MKKYLILVIIGQLVWAGVMAQNEQMKIRYQEYLQGDISVIGNSIVNRKTLFANTSKPYDRVDQKAKNNEHFVMKYINIDSNEANFSSSSAFLTINTTDKLTLKYAGLYWTATYPYTEGKLMGKDRFVPVKHSKENFDAVRIKLPQSNSYKTILGEIIYNGKELENEPYVVYADITNLLKEHTHWQGEYFVSNIRSASGKVKGGICAGWTIVFVYEKENEPLKNIISYDGFLPIKGQKNIIFEGLNTPSDTKAKILGASLGADVGSESTISVYTLGNESVELYTDTRKVNNFFNSSITDNNDYVYSRKPSSLNTLGFDVFCLDIDNQNNSVIPERSSTLTLQINSNQDTAYLFMTTLSINQTPNPKTEFEIYQETLHTIEAIKSEQEVKESIKDTQEIEDQYFVKHLSVTGQKSGFYVILGVFSSQQNTENFITDLEDNQIHSSYFYDKEKKLFYIYESCNQTYREAEIRREKIRNQLTDDQYFKDLKQSWILGVNLPISLK